MKKLTTFALIILALFSGVLFSACGDKYKKLSMKIVYTDGQTVEELVLIKDDSNSDLATKRIGIKFSGIDEDDIGQVAVYSSPSELFTTSNEKYSGNYYYIDITAIKPATGELVVKHLSSDKTKKVKLRIEQKANDLTATNKKYVVAVNNVAEGEVKTHTLNAKDLVSLKPSTSTDKVYFKEVVGNSLPSGVKKVEEVIDNVTYVVGFEILNSAVASLNSFKLIPVTKMKGYDDKSYDDALHNDYEIVEIFFENVLTNENVVLDTDEKHKDDEGSIYETIYLVANETRADLSGKYNYNNALFNLKTLEEIEKGNTAGFKVSDNLDNYDIVINKISNNASAIQATHTGNGTFVVQATATTQNNVEVEFNLIPSNIVGDVATITKKVVVKGVVRSDYITVEKNGELVDTTKIIDIYNYVAGNGNGLKFNFKAMSKSEIDVYSDLSMMRIEIAPEILYLNVKDNYYTNIKAVDGSAIPDSVKQIGANRDLADAKNLIRIFKGNSYLNFQYDDRGVFVSEPFMDFTDLYLKYVENTDPFADNEPLQIKITAGYEGSYTYLKDIYKTETILSFDATEGVKELNVFASTFVPGAMGGSQYSEITDDNGGEPILANNIYINKDDTNIVWDGDKNTNGYALCLLEDLSIVGVDNKYLNNDVEFDISINYNSQINNPIKLKDEIGYVTDKLTIQNLEKNIEIIVDKNTNVGHYVVTFKHANGYSKSINIYIYQAFDENKHLSIDFAEGELDNDSFKNSYLDAEGNKQYTFVDYKADYIVYSGKKLNLTANVRQDVLDSNIIKGYKYVSGALDNLGTETDKLVVDNYFNFSKDSKNAEKGELNFLRGTVQYDSSSEEYLKYYISFTVQIETKVYNNIFEESIEEKNVGEVTITFFIYERIVENKVNKAKILHPTYELYMSDYLGYNNLKYGKADLSVILDGDINNDDGTITRGGLWTYVQIQDGETRPVKWKHNQGINVVSLEDFDDYAVTAVFKKDANKTYYSCSIAAELSQFGKSIEIDWNVIVYMPNLTEELRLTSAEPKFDKLSNSIFEYNLDLQEGDEFTVTADQISSLGQVSHKGLSLVVASVADGNVSDAVTVSGNTIKVNRIQAGLRLIVYPTDVLKDDVARYRSGFNNPEQFILERKEEEYKYMYKKAYFIINLHLEDGKTRETAYSVYDLNDFEKMMIGESGKWYRIMNDINLTGLKVFNKEFNGHIYSGNNQNYTLYDLKLTAENKNLFTTFEGGIENITFETEYAYDTSTSEGNLGIIGELKRDSILKYVKTIVSGKSELNTYAYKFGLIVGVNNDGKIHYYEKLEGNKYTGKLCTAVRGRIVIKGNADIKFGGIAGVNNGEIIGVNYNESDLTGSASQNITFATSTEQQGALVNIDLIAKELFCNENSSIGGIVGENCGKLINAYVTGVINAPNVSNVGGAIGKAKLDESTAEHIKSNVIITAKDYVGGIVGKDECGVYKHCWYQILPTTEVGIEAKLYVGGIVGYSKHSKLQFCSVFSYKYDYESDVKYFASLEINGEDKQPDIKGTNYVAGLVGYAVYANFDVGVTDITESTIVKNSSVDAVITSEDQVGAIYTTIAIRNPVGGFVYSSYFIGKLNGNFIPEENSTTIDGQLCLDNLGSSISDEVYTLNFNGTDFVLGKTLNFNISAKADYWNLYNGVNLDRIYVTSDKDKNKPIFDLVPSSFDVVVASDDSKTLNTYFYDFSISGANENELKSLNEKFNQYNLIDLFEFTYAPGGNIMVAVSSTDTNVIDVIGGRLVVLGLGESTLRFNPVLNPNLVCEINVKVADNLSKLIVTEDGKNPLTAIGIAKDKTKQLQTYSVGEVVAANGLTYTYKSTKQYGMLLDLTWITGSGKISDYITVNTDKDENIIVDDEFNLTVYVPYGTPLSFTSKEIGGLFKVQVTPCISKGLPYSSAQSAEFELATWQGVRDISLNYNSAIVYPNDITTLIATITTDLELTTESQVKELIHSVYLIVDGNETQIYDFDKYLTIKINARNTTTSKQVIEFTIRIDSEFEKIAKPCKLKINFKSAYTAFETVDYTILPQRIDKIEAKSYIYTDFAAGAIEQSEVLKPNNLGLLVIDIAPINGYFDYLEIDDVTGNEEIKFIQLDGKNGSSLFETDIPSANRKGIRLAKLDSNGDGIADSIYVTMQIDKNYSSKIHTLKITAYYQENGIGTVIKTDYKYIDVKMLPIIKVEHQLPNGESNLYDEQSQIPNTLYFANGTSEQFRITTQNTTEPLQYSYTKGTGVNGGFELVNTHGDFYVLRNNSFDENDCGKTITITLTAKSVIANNIETTTLEIKFTIVKYVIHSISVTNSNSKGEIYGNTGVKTDIEVYFRETDITYNNNGTYHDVDYRFNSALEKEIKPGDTPDVVTQKSINNILRELNKDAATNNYLILNGGLKTNYSRPSSGSKDGKYNSVINDASNTQDDINLTYDAILKTNVLMVKPDYNRESYLAVDMELKLDDEYNWNIQSEIDNETHDLSKNYKLNFNKPYSEEDYMLVKNVEDFLAMESGKRNYYILGNDIELKDYTPMDIDIAEFDGNGRTITIRSFSIFKDANVQAGLFKQVYEGMVVKNVNVVYETDRVETVYTFGRVGTDTTSGIEDFKIEYSDLCNDESVNYTSAVFGGLTPKNEGVVTNCTVNGEIALRASTVEKNKTSTNGGNYAVSFNIGGLVGENSSSGFITHSTSGLKIFALANIGGLVYDNQGKISSSAVEGDAVIYSYNVNLDKTILVEVGGFVSQNSGSISMSHTTLNYSYTAADNAVSAVYKGIMSTKDESAGFVYLNSGNIKNCYVQQSKIGNNGGIYCGFVYSNSGAIANSYTSINEGADAGASTYMFAQDGTENLVDCLEFVYTEDDDYVKDASIGLKTLDYNDILNNSSLIKETFKQYNFVFGSKDQAVWTMDNVDLPVLVACEDKVRYMLDQNPNGNKYFGLRNFEYVEKEIKYEDGSTGFEMKVEFTDDAYGKKENPFIIANLSNWENRIYNNTSSYYRIVADIEFSSNANPSTSNLTFSGNIQGNDMILNNIKLYLQGEVDALGLFKQLVTANNIRIDNSIRNLTLKTTTAWASKADAIGVLGGKAIGFNIYNITVDSPDVVIVGGNAVGGVVGYVGGEFDIDGISSNISVNSTRELSTYTYSIYAGKNNKLDSNLQSVFYAGCAFGILDGYNGEDYNINKSSGREINSKYFNVNHINISGSPVLIGDTVGSAFGFVGERVYVNNVKVLLEDAEFKGYQYSAGLAGENRGVIDKSSVVIKGECFNETNYAAAGVVGLNVGGLIRNVTAEVNIVKNANISIGGILARNINGVVNNVKFDGVVCGNITGGIMAANYSKEIFIANGGPGAINAALNLNLIVPDAVKYKQSGNVIEFEDLTLSEKTLQYFFDNILSFYTYKEKSVDDKKSLIQENYKAFGLFAGMTDLTNSEIQYVYYDNTNKVIMMNSSERLNRITNKLVGYEFISDETPLKKGEAYWLMLNGEIKTDDPSLVKENVRVIPMSLDNVYTIYITGVKVNNFDSWDRSNFTDDFIVFGNVG